MEEKLREAARLIAGAHTVVALTGAGISIDSGIPAFRGSQGLWEKFDPMEYASIDALTADPVKVWDMLTELEKVVSQAKPNQAHTALARLEEMGRLTAVVTQNIDGLHQIAGSKQVIEFHGNGQKLRCLDCTKLYEREQVSFDPLPPRCACGGLIKPDIIFFGEEIPPKALLKSFALAESCQVMLVAGTSAVVAPASHLPVIAKKAGAKIVEINPEPTPLSDEISDYVFNAGGAEIIPALVKMVGEEI